MAECEFGELRASLSSIVGETDMVSGRGRHLVHGTAKTPRRSGVSVRLPSSSARRCPCHGNFADDTIRE